ncbi:DUF6988 family protein [Chitiniphilus eburneus]|uniref:HEPN domain-containing protein n=1 Tax=Chitiniphilus eburneus TaxID=2571148 RepID=A0A4U0PNF7_9NEIS|nr:hypothetical protein [Chitiniphilus eburneus]TJZ69751.1 hypothetical protein FAZ21_14630 [Chitiniphilus eburneus]
MSFFERPATDMAMRAHYWIIERLEGLQGIKTNKCAIACFDVALEHHLAISILIRAGAVGSAFSLVRSQFESFVRGMWLAQCATNDVVENYENDNFKVPMGDMVKDLDAAIPNVNGYFTKLKNDGWRAMNSYTHCGAHQVSRRFLNGDIFPGYSEKEIEEVAELTTKIALGAAFALAAYAERNDITDEINSYVPT